MPDDAAAGLGRGFINAQPNADRCEFDGGQIIGREFVVLGRDTPTSLSDIAPGGAKLVHALLMRPIGRSQRVVREEPLR
jgi:hypothetical protein